MSGSRTTKFLNFLADKLALTPGFDQGQQSYHGYSSYQQQYAAAQNPVEDYSQQPRAQGTQYNGPATVNDDGRQHIGDHNQGDDQRVHASDQATLFNERVYYANTYNVYYQGHAATAAAAGDRPDHTSSAPPATTAFPPPPGRPDLPPRQESAPVAQSSTPDWSDVVHLANCDNCAACPIRGIRWRCLTCPDHDICNRCKIEGKDEGHPFKQLPSLRQPPIQLSSLGAAAAQGSQYGILSQLTPGCAVKLCEFPRQDPLVIAARSGHFQVCQTLMERLGGVYPSQSIQAAIRAAQTCTTGYMGPLLARYLESQAILIEQRKAQGAWGGYTC